MREILFRGKTESGCWTRGSLSLYSEPGKVEILYPVNFEDEDGNVTPSFDYVEVDPETVGQFTGLLDKNGKRIFEGDIVMTKYGRLCVVVWFSSRVYNGWDLDPVRTSLNLAYTKPPERPDLYCQEYLKIVGNIHDNPELLKETV